AGKHRGESGHGSADQHQATVAGGQRRAEIGPDGEVVRKARTREVAGILAPGNHVPCLGGVTRPQMDPMASRGMAGDCSAPRPGTKYRDVQRPHTSSVRTKPAAPRWRTSIQPSRAWPRRSRSTPRATMKRAGEVSAGAARTVAAERASRWPASRNSPARIQFTEPST